MVDCAIVLRHEWPFLIGGSLAVAGPAAFSAEAPAATERVASGIARLDAMLGGGYFARASVLITGIWSHLNCLLLGNMASMCSTSRRRYGEHAHHIQGSCVVCHPQTALDNGVLLSPRVVKLGQTALRSAIGNLGDRAAVLDHSGLQGTSS